MTISFLSDAEITSRIHPGLYALLTALGGIAIAIALVPPLCVVGIALQQGQLDAAAGASLLIVVGLLFVSIPFH